MRNVLTFISAAGLSLLLASVAHAQVPKLIRYQGQAVDSQGVPLEGSSTLQRVRR